MDSYQEDSYLNDQHAYGVIALRALSQICSERKIPFYLLAGSCLGAVRHAGFIPWDDDIDVGFLNEDYERFKAAAQEEFPKYGLEFRDHTIRHQLPRMLGKVIRPGGYGVLDCFRLVRVPDNELHQIIQWHAKRFLYGVWKRQVQPPKTVFSSSKRKFLWNIRTLMTMPIALLVPSSLIAKQMLWVESHHGKSTKYVSNFYSVYSRKKELIPIEWLDSPSYLMFEDMCCPVPQDVDSYLTNLYGDYMTPPAKSSRNPNHSLNIFG